MRRRELLLGAAAGALLARPTVAVASRRDGDGDVIKPFIAREERVAHAYRAAGLGEGAELATAHAEALRTEFQALGRGTAPIAADDLDGPSRRLAAAAAGAARLDAAIALEADLVRAYSDALTRLFEPGIVQTAGTILACHAQQRAVLARRAGRDPF